MTEETVTCNGCDAEIDPLAVFPGGICVACYAQTPEANRPHTADEISGMWGAPSVGEAKMTKTRATIDHLRRCQAARAAGQRLSRTTDPAWLVEQAINRRAGWLEEPHTRGTTPPVDGHLPRKARGDWQRHLRLIAREVNTPRLIVRVARLGEHRWLADRLPHRFETA